MIDHLQTIGSYPKKKNTTLFLDIIYTNTYLLTFSIIWMFRAGELGWMWSCFSSAVSFAIYYIVSSTLPHLRAKLFFASDHKRIILPDDNLATNVYLSPSLFICILYFNHLLRWFLRCSIFCYTYTPSPSLFSVLISHSQHSRAYTVSWRLLA